MTPDTIILAIGLTVVAGFHALVFAPEIAALFRSRPPKGNARKGDRKQGE